MTGASWPFPCRPWWCKPGNISHFHQIIRIDFVLRLDQADVIGQLRQRRGRHRPSIARVSTSPGWTRMTTASGRPMKYCTVRLIHSAMVRLKTCLQASGCRRAHSLPTATVFHPGQAWLEPAARLAAALLATGAQNSPKAMPADEPSSTISSGSVGLRSGEYPSSLPRACWFPAASPRCFAPPRCAAVDR